MRRVDSKEGLNLTFDALERDVARLGRASAPQVYMFGANSLDTAAADRYFWPFRTSSTADAAEKQVPVLRDGRVVGLTVFVPDIGAAAAARTVQFVLRYDGKDTTMRAECTLPQNHGVFHAKLRPFAVKRDGLLSLVVRKSGALTTSPATCIAFVEVE